MTGPKKFRVTYWHTMAGCSDTAIVIALNETEARWRFYAGCVQPELCQIRKVEVVQR